MTLVKIFKSIIFLFPAIIIQSANIFNAFNTDLCCNISHVTSSPCVIASEDKKTILTKRHNIKHLFDPSWYQYWLTVYQVEPKHNVFVDRKGTFKEQIFKLYQKFSFDILYRRSKISFILGSIQNQFNDRIPLIIKGTGKRTFVVSNGKKREFYSEALKNVGFNVFVKNVPNKEILRFPEGPGLDNNAVSDIINLTPKLNYSGTYWGV